MKTLQVKLPYPGYLGGIKLQDEHRNYVASWHGEEKDAARVVACYNALAGIPDPEAAIRAAREALQHLLEWEPRVKDEDEAAAWNEAREALTLLTPKP